MREIKIPKNELMMACGLIVFAALSRFSHIPNFTALGAVAIFSGTTIKDKRIAFLIPLLALVVTDFYFGFHQSMLPVYLCYSLSTLLGIIISNKRTRLNIIAASFASSLIFFLITNLPIWYTNDSLYSLNLAGTLESYIAAEPFFRNETVSTLLYSGVLFFVFDFVTKRKLAAVNS